MSFRSLRLGFKDASRAGASSWRDDNAKTIVDHCSRRRTDCSAQQNVVLIHATNLHEAERLIESYEHCNPEGAEIPFDNILDRITGSDPSVTDYVLERPAKCPNCKREILEKTLIEPR